MFIADLTSSPSEENDFCAFISVQHECFQGEDFWDFTDVSYNGSYLCVSVLFPHCCYEFNKLCCIFFKVTPNNCLFLLFNRNNL